MPGKPISHSILVIDDEANLRHTLALILKRTGYTITTAGNGAEARLHLHASPFDLIFLDLKMPDIDGLKLLPEIRALYPDLPVLILTAHATLESAIEAVRLGARDYLLKPFDPSQLLKRVEDILAEAKPPRRRREIVGELHHLLKELDELDGAEPGAASHLVVHSPDPSRYLQRGIFTLDLHAHLLTLDGVNVQLSPTAFDYLATLLRHSPHPVTYEILVMESQGYKPNPIEARDMSRWRVHELRKALEPDPRQPKFLITVRNVGYRLVV